MKQNDKPDENTPLKVFFITSNEAFHDKKITIRADKNWMDNLERIFIKKIDYNNVAYIVSIYSFQFTQKTLKPSDFDATLKKYRAIVKLSFEKNKFEGKILFKKEQNNFIYDFKFEPNAGFFNIVYPPISINFKKIEQLKIYGEYMKSKKIKQDNLLSINLILDSQQYLTENKKDNNSNGKIFTLEYFLELLKMCYNQKEVKTLLMRFKLERIIFKKELEAKNYSSILNLLYKKPEKIIQHCTEKDNKERYYKLFYSLLLYFRNHYDHYTRDKGDNKNNKDNKDNKDKKDNEKLIDNVKELISREDLWQYFVDILPTNHEYFYNTEIPEKLIEKILSQTPLKYDVVIGTFKYLISLELILININKYCDSIFKCCEGEKEKKIK
jgi:hypothetical protein